MVHILSIPENVVIQQLLPLLNHNDILRLRRVSKQTKAFADTFLWTPKPGHQGKWELEIDSTKEGQTLQAFIQCGPLPPPSRLRIIHNGENPTPAQLCPRYSSFFEDDYLEIFMERYSKYVTRLSVDILQLPFTSTKETKFFESLVNLEYLCVDSLKTIGGATEFGKKTRNPEGSFLLRPTFKKLKTLKLISTDCMDSMWIFINGVSNNLGMISHPFIPKNEDGDGDNVKLATTLASVRSLIERRRLTNKSNLLYDWGAMSPLVLRPSELLPLFAVCRDNGVMIKNLIADFLISLFYDENGRYMGENYTGNFYVGNIIYSLMSLHDNVFVLKLPGLEKIEVHGTVWSSFRIREGRGYPEWPNLRKMYVMVNDNSAVNLFHVLCGFPQLRRSQLEDLSLNYFDFDARIIQNSLPLPCPRNLGICCGNLKKLTLTNCYGDNNFFVGLWEGLPLLEEVQLFGCPKLTNKGFVGNGARGSTPVFLKLKNLKVLGIHNLKATTRITDAAFRNVFRHLKLSSFELCSDEAVNLITLDGIKELLTGPFAETIEKLDLDGLALRDASDEELEQVVSCFRSAKML